MVPSYFAAYGKSHPSISEEVLNEKDADLNGNVLSGNILGSGDSTHQAAVRNSASDEDDSGPMKRGMVLSFAPLSLTFDNIRYWPCSRALKPGLIRLFFYSEQCFSLTNSSSIPPNHLNSSKIQTSEQVHFVDMPQVAIRL